MQGSVKAGVVGCIALAGVLCGGAAQAGAVGVGLRGGTLGLGGEATIGLGSRVNLRVPFNTFSYSDQRTEDGIDYDGKLKLQSLGAQIDLHPFKGSFFLTAGLFSNGNKLRLHASDPTGEEEYELGDSEDTYTSDPNNPLDLKAALDFKSTAPYLGLGWGNPIQGDSNFYFCFELGALFQGAGKVGIDASGSAVNQDGESFDVDGDNPAAQQFQADLEQERASLESDIGDFKIYPAISFALGYRFKF